MRRVVFFCLLLMLPIQGVWSAVVGFGLQNGHCMDCPSLAQHGGDDVASCMPGHGADTGDEAAAGCCEASCPACSGHGIAALISVSGVPCARDAGGVVARTARGAPDHVPDQPLRPPLARTA